MVLREVNYVWLKRKFCKLMKPVPRIYYDKTKDKLFIFRHVHTLVIMDIYSNFTYDFVYFTWIPF